MGLSVRVVFMNLCLYGPGGGETETNMGSLYDATNMGIHSLFTYVIEAV